MNPVKQLLKFYNIKQPVKSSLIRKGPDNEVHMIACNDGSRYVLRISKRKVEDIDFELEILSKLKKNGIRVTPSIPTKTGLTHMLTANGIMGVLFPFVEGKHIEFGKDQKPNLGKVAQAAQTLADFHKSGLEIKANNKRARTIYTEMERVVSTKDKFEANFLEGKEFLSIVKEYIDWGKSQSAPNGIIHNDFRPGNIFFNEKEVETILDFDWSCRGPIWKDLGLALAEWSFPDGAKEPWMDVFETFYKNYFDNWDKDYPGKSEICKWICFACLSDTCTYLADVLEEEYVSSPRPIKSFMFSKFIYFKKQI